MAIVTIRDLMREQEPMVTMEWLDLRPQGS